MEENRLKHKKYLLALGLIALLVVVSLGVALNPGGRAWLVRTWQSIVGNRQKAGSFSELFPPEGQLTTQALTVDGHVYRLKISADKKQLVPLPGESANFDIQLMEGGRTLSSLPSPLAKNAKAQSPTLQVKITGVANIYENDADHPPVSTTRLPGAGAYIYSPQATDRFSYPYKKDTLEATLDFGSGSAQINYLYGGGKIKDRITLQATAIFYDGQIKQGAELPFADEKIIATSKKIPPPQYLKKDVCYQVAFAPARVDTEKEVNVKLTVKSIDSKTGRVDTNPYQRVRIELWPMRAFYAFSEARFEEAGKFLTASRLAIPASLGGTTLGGYSYDPETGERISPALGHPNTDNPGILSSIYWYLVEGANSFTAKTSTEADKKTLTWLDQQIINYQEDYLSNVYTEKQMADYLASMELLPTHINYAELDLVDGIGEVYFRYSGNVGAVPYVTFVISPVDFMSLNAGKFPYCDSDDEYWSGYYLPANNHRNDSNFCMVRRMKTSQPQALYKSWMLEDDFKKLQRQIQTVTYLPVDR
ncbi:hypothetical protein JXA59_01725 [Patescibacteria group bacterium]|nr:hypothetical protein [Patescibacteria group bacterium]